MSTHQAILSFNNGEGSPYLTRRIDFDKTGSTCEVLRNFIPLSFGAATKRPGLVSVGAAEFAGLNSKVFPFTASDGTSYVIHLTAGAAPKITIYRLDGTVADTLALFPGYEWPVEFTWANSIRDFQMENVNDVAFFTHPVIHPFQLIRTADSSWSMPFVPFTSAPMLDENLDENKLLTVVSNPIAPTWAAATVYGSGDVVFSGLTEWECTENHTADNAKKPGTGADWRGYWRRKFYQEGDPITITSKNKKAPPAWEEQFAEYLAGSIYSHPSNGATWDTGEPLYYCHTGYTCTGVVSGVGSDDPFYDSYYGAGEELHWYIIFPWYGTGIATTTIGTNLYVTHLGTIYHLLLTHDTSDADTEPGVGVDWETYWEVESVISGEPPVWHMNDGYVAGQKVSRKGHEYVCLADHETAAAVNRPGTGSDWETYWLETSRFLESFAISDVSPGTYWRLSPERDDQDFQIEMIALAANDGLKSDAIAVDGGWNIFTYGTWTGTFIIQKSTDNAATWDTIRKYQAKDDRNVSDSGFEQSPCLLRLGFRAETGTQTSGKQRALLIPETNYVTGEALMTEYVDADEMRGFARTGMLSGKTYRWAQGAFSEEFGFPAALCLHERRLVFAGTARNPVSLWASADDDLLNFEVGTLATDGLFRTLPVGNQYPIRWLASMRRMFIGTSQNEWVVGSETTDSPLTPENYFERRYTSTGSGKIQPVKCTSGLLFPGRKGGRLYELQHTTESGYECTDLSQLAEHLTKAGIISMAWQQTRLPGLWVVTRDGGLLHFAYSKAERVFAWSRHDTDGAVFRDVVVLPSDEGDDHVLFILDRDDASELVRLPQHWMETMETGEAPAGSYSDTEAALAIVSELVTLPIDSQADTGTTQGRRKRSHKILLDLFLSQGGAIWNRDIDKKQLIAGNQSAISSGWKETIPDAGALDDLQLKIYHDDDQPFTVRAAVVRWQLNEP